MTKYNKLVRDNIPQKLDKLWVLYEMRVASEEEHQTKLYKKLDEEMREIKEA